MTARAPYFETMNDRASSVKGARTMTMELWANPFFNSPVSMLIVAAVVFLLFGNRLPQVMRSLGRSVVEFKKGVAGIEDDLEEAVNEAEAKAKSKSKPDVDEAEA